MKYHVFDLIICKFISYSNIEFNIKSEGGKENVSLCKIKTRQKQDIFCMTFKKIIMKKGRLLRMSTGTDMFRISVNIPVLIFLLYIGKQFLIHMEKILC